MKIESFTDCRQNVSYAHGGRLIEKSMYLSKGTLLPPLVLYNPPYEHGAILSKRTGVRVHQSFPWIGNKNDVHQSPSPVSSFKENPSPGAIRDGRGNGDNFAYGFSYGYGYDFHLVVIVFDNKLLFLKGC